MQHLYKLSGSQLYQKAIEFKLVENYDNYIIYMTVAANKEYQPAIDIIYSDKIYQKQNYNKTLQFYQTTANDPYLAQNSYSIHFLAYMYDCGHGVKQDNIKAISLYKLAIEKGCVVSLHNLAFIYFHDTNKNYDKAIELYKLAIKKNYIRSLGQIIAVWVKMYENDIKAENCFCDDYIYDLVIKNDVTSQMHDLAFLHEKWFVPNDYTKALKLYNICLPRMYPSTLNNLAFMYYDGRGVKKNYDKAIELWVNAVIHKCVASYENLGDMYVSKNIEIDETERLYKLAIEHDRPLALDKLVNLYTKSAFKDKKNEIIEYFNKINRLDKLNKLYKFDDYTISIIRDNYQYKSEINDLKNKITDLETHIAVSPEGHLYFEAKKEWDNNKQKTAS